MLIIRNRIKAMMLISIKNNKGNDNVVEAIVFSHCSHAINTQPITCTVVPLDTVPQ
jgi:hypothetical protein